MTEPSAPAGTSPSPRSTVALAECADYSRANVERAVGKVIGLLGGIGHFVRSGENVLLKPNLLAARSPDEAVTTHPEIFRAVAKMCLDAGGRVTAGDSPGVGKFSSVAGKSGLAAAADELGVILREFTEAVEVERPEGARFRKLLLARAVTEADAVINLPKVKTHQQMFLTLAVKNLFGCIVGKEKIAWHMNAGRDAALFARLLVEVCQSVAPRLSIADGVLGMEGTGPSHGAPRWFRFIAASADPFALDAVLTSQLGFRLADLPVLAAADAARSDGLPVGPTDLNHIDIVGCGTGGLRAARVRPPVMGRLMFVPGFLSGITRRLITVRPRVSGALCRACGVCVDSCPAGAMKIVDHKVRIDDTVCIRCFCCQELCPYGAVVVRRGLLSTFFAG
ncbi:MAG: DUF362 domain-containing protein [Planctomycetota bacterium]